MSRLAVARAERARVAGQQAHEMTNMNFQSPPNSSSDAAGPSAFLSEVTALQDQIERVNANVRRIAEIQLRSLGAITISDTQHSEKLDELATDTRALTREIKERIQALERTPPGADAQMRKNRIGLLRNKFLEALQNYKSVEQEYRVKSRQRVERQLKLVKPDATEQEVRAAVDGGDGQIFAQALTVSTRYGESRAAYREVQERQHDLQRMEQTLAELGQLFVDMGTLVEQQDETIVDIEQTAQHISDDTGKGVEHTGVAVVHAKSYRKMRWICFFIFLFVCAVLAIVLGVVFGKK